MVSRADNCFDSFYGILKSGVTAARVKEEVFPRLKKAYWSSPKPKSGFDASKTNVVIHARRGDAGERAMDYSYLKKIVHILSKKYSKAIFWIHTDAHPGEIYQSLKENKVDVRIFGQRNSVSFVSYIKWLWQTSSLCHDPGYH